MIHKTFYMMLFLCMLAGIGYASNTQIGNPWIQSGTNIIQQAPGSRVLIGTDFTSVSPFTRGVDVELTNTETTGAVLSNAYVTQLTAGSSSSITLANIYSRPNVPITQTTGYTGTLAAFWAQPQIDCTGCTVATATSYVDNFNVGPNGATLTTQRSFSAGVAVGATSTITNREGVRIANPTGSGTVVNNTGLLILAQTKGTTTNLAIDSQGGVNKFTGQLELVGVTQASLGADVNGTIRYCSDCTIANPCAGAGTGALAKRLNGVWVCN